MLKDDVLKLTDPVHDKNLKLGPINSYLARFVRDQRDLPFVRLSLFLAAIFIPFAVFMIIPGNFRWWMAPIYWALYLWYLGPFVLMLHNTSHRVLFKREYGILNRFIPWVVGPHLGQTPETYFAHHMGMHHAEGNLAPDLSSTMKYQRDSFVDFMKYYLSFAIFGLIQLGQYLHRNGKKKLLKRMIIGEAAFYLVAATACAITWQAGVTVYVVPFVLTRFLLMTGNWTQHAFVDPEGWDNDYRTVVSFINSPYNWRCFNDGYHLGHHLKASRHWLDMPQDLLDKKQKMIENQSLVFRKVDYFMIWVLLMLKRYNTLAKFYVQLDPENPLSEDEIVALLKRRTAKFDMATLESSPAPA